MNCYELQTLLKSLGWWSPFVYILFSTLMMMLFVPRTLFLVLAGICFSEFQAVLWALTSSLLSSVLSFGLARTYGRAWVEKTFRKRNWFYRLERITAKSGFHFVLIARISHVIHFGATSYACGVLNIGFKSFLWGSFWGVLPGTIIAIVGSKVLGCKLWDGSANFSEKDIYLSVFTSFLVLFSSLIPLWLNRKKKS
ncbi:TVP38/TMEM64 family protein [bacterium]|nr:TVP38/TMEM64 family protein [bacterium]